jgi:hypothetical protein
LDAHELEAAEPPTSELASQSIAAVELPGNSSYPVELPGSLPSQLLKLPPSNTKDTNEHGYNAKQRPTIELYPPNNRRGSADAPEASLLGRKDENYSPSLRKGTLHEQVCVPTFASKADRLSPSLSPAFSTSKSRAHSFHYIEDRRARFDFRQNQENCLHPGMLSKLHTLVLTGVPTTTTDVRIIKRLTQYIKDAAEEASIARQRARHTYMLPPGRSRLIAEREYAHELFALRRIVLEIAPPQAAPKKISASWRAYPPQKMQTRKRFGRRRLKIFPFLTKKNVGSQDMSQAAHYH